MERMETRGMADQGRKRDMMGRITDEGPSGPTFTPPSGAKLTGDSGTATISWKRCGNGEVEITAVNGTSIGSASEESPKEQASESPEEEFDEYD